MLTSTRYLRRISSRLCLCCSAAAQKPVNLHLNSYSLRVIKCNGVVRWNSSTTGSLSDTNPTEVPGYIPEPPSSPEPGADVSGIVEPLQQLNALGEPTLQSLGLGGYWPPGLMQTGLEWLHVSLDLPWWAAIVAGTMVVRTMMFPVVIKAQQNAAKMHNHMPTMTRLQERFTKARMSGNALEAARSGQELYSFMDRNKINPFKSFWPSLAQIPVFLSVFLGLRRMANLPMESMMTGGILWFTDLTVTDPTYLLPLLTSVTLLVTVEVGADSVKAGNMSHGIKWVMRGMPIVIFPIIMNFPAAMLCYWLTSNVFSLAQVLLLRVEGIRSACGIEQLVKHPVSDLPARKGFVQGFRESWDNAKTSSQIQDRARVDALKFKEAGKGPLIKTYSYDPTKPKPQTIKPKDIR